MGASGQGRIGSLHLPGDSPLHRLPPQCKVGAAVLLTFAVVATPREQIWAFAGHAAVIVTLALLSQIPAVTFLRRLTVELPFVAFALVLPFLAEDGGWAAWNILAKATLGTATSVVLTATTAAPDIVRGLQRLRVPAAIVAILTFMIRYLDVVMDELERQQIARRSRGHDARWFWQARAVAHCAGSLFVRAFERGERVHLSMLSRGYDGAIPSFGAEASVRAWTCALAVPAVAAGLAVAASAVAA